MKKFMLLAVVVSALVPRAQAVSMVPDIIGKPVVVTVPPPPFAGFLVETQYRHDLFHGDEKAYQEARRAMPYLNRYQWISFEPDGSVSVMLSDVPNKGSYKVEIGKLVVTFKDVEEDGRPITAVFTISNGLETLTEPGGRSWERVEKTSGA